MFSALDGGIGFGLSKSKRSAIARSVAASVEILEPRWLLASVPAGFQADQAYGGTITNGTAMDFSPDGRLWVTTQTGDVRVIQPNAATSSLALHLTVNSFFERGLLGIAFQPGFGETNNYVFLYYTELPSGQNPTSYSGQTTNRVSRFEVSGDTITAASETLLMRFDTLNAGNHNGGGTHFGPDGKLYVALGENASPSNAQSLSNRLGKILRLNPDPLNPIPGDNPTTFDGIAGTTTGNNRAIYAVGLRNPYTFAFQPGTGRLHINDVGQDSWEEVNLGAAGKNYGWPTTEGAFNPATFPNFTNPVYTYQNVGSAIAITGGSFYSPTFNQFGADYTGDYFLADLGAGWMRRLDGANSYALHTTGGVSDGTNWITGASTIVDIKVANDTGSLLFLQRAGSQGVRIIRTINPQVVSNAFLYDGVSLPGAPHRVQFKFTNNVGASLQPSDLLLSNQNGSIDSSNIAVSYNSTTNVATFTFPGFTNGILPNGNYTATLQGSQVTDTEGDPILADKVFGFFVLAGDADHNGVINFDDYAFIDNGYNNGYSGFSNGDFDYNGVINFDDYSIIDNAFNSQNRNGGRNIGDGFQLPTD